MPPWPSVSRISHVPNRLPVVMDTALKVRRDDGAAPHADYSDYHVLSSSTCRRSQTERGRGIVAAGWPMRREALPRRQERRVLDNRLAVSLSVGDQAPEFSLPGSDGKQHSLASYRGRQAVVLAWFPAFTEG